MCARMGRERLKGAQMNSWKMFSVYVCSACIVIVAAAASAYVFPRFFSFEIL